MYEYNIKSLFANHNLPIGNNLIPEIDSESTLLFSYRTLVVFEI